MIPRNRDLLRSCFISPFFDFWKQKPEHRKKRSRFTKQRIKNSQNRVDVA